MIRILKRVMMGIFVIVFVAVVVAVACVVVPNAIMCVGQQANIKTEDQLKADGQHYDCILVLGASVAEDGTPSSILQDRLDTGIQLYNAGVAPKIIVSGDDQSDSNYDEVTAMKAYMVAQGVPSVDVFCDHAGVNTYDSMYRARYVFQADNMVVVTQTYHLYRALYDANGLNVQSVGVASDLRPYAKQLQYDIREVAARCSDFVKVSTHAKAETLSEPVSLDQSGDVTSW